MEWGSDTILLTYLLGTHHLIAASVTRTVDAYFVSDQLPIIFIGCEHKSLDAIDGIFPDKVYYSTGDLSKEKVAEYEENRRLFYVGITRSSNNLYIYVPREIGDRQVSPSRFLGKKGDKNGTWRN